MHPDDPIVLNVDAAELPSTEGKTDKTAGVGGGFSAPSEKRKKGGQGVSVRASKARQHHTESDPQDIYLEIYPGATDYSLFQAHVELNLDGHI